MRQRPSKGVRRWLMAAACAAFGGPVAAQVALFDEPALIAACQQQACVAEVESILTQMRTQEVAEEEFNSQIGFIAAILLDSAGSAEVAVLPQMGAALTVLGQSSSDARQGAAIAQVAGAVVRGEAGAIAASAPYAASPSRPFNWRNRLRPPFRSGRGPGRNRSRWFGFWRR